MTNIAVTGSTGHFGSYALEYLINLGVPAEAITALARNLSKTSKLLPLSVQVRQADYNQPGSLEQALEGIDKLLLVSGSEIGQRVRQHNNVIQAAKKAGVKLLVYTSIFHADTSVSPMAPEHRESESILKDSGIPYVILRNNWYTENYLEDVKRAGQTGLIQAAAGNGKVASALRKEYAEAAAHVLSEEGHEGKIYELCGEAWSYAELARVTEDIFDKPVEYQSVSMEVRKQQLTAAGLSLDIADFVTAIDQSIEAGTLDGNDKDLEMLLKRKPMGLKEALIKLIK